MAVKITFDKELNQLKEYIKSEANEDAKRPLLYPLFQKLYKDKVKVESDAKGSDVYVEGNLIVEAKSKFDDWLKGFYQALHYQKKYGLAFTTIMVIAYKFVGIWKVNQMPEFAVALSYKSDSNTAPNDIGRINAKQTSNIEKNEIKETAIYWLEPKNLTGDYFKDKDKGVKSLIYEGFEILNILKNINSDRIQINTHNFIQSIEYFKKFFDLPIDAVHCFYTIVAYWDITSSVAINEVASTFTVNGFKGKRNSEPISINQKHFRQLEKYIESHYIFTNEGSGLTVDYYFSRFDEVMAAIDPEYVKQHGIFFTDSNLSKFALWFASSTLTKFGTLSKFIEDDYIVFDPAGGSGNLISSWKGKLKHKIISELQPDLLRTIERRMKIDPWHVETGFTIIPKTSENKGLNFLDVSAEEYLLELEKELKLKNQYIDKPIAFLLNPPYKNTDENVKVRDEKDAEYELHPTIIELTGSDAAKERYLAFLGQILNISKIQNEKDLHPIVLIFTPSSWLIPRPTYAGFRNIWDKHFEYINGFIVRSNEFFKLQGAWPLAFTIWKYKFNEELQNNININDFTALTKNDLQINWALQNEELNFIISSIIEKEKVIRFDNSRGDIRENLPEIEKNGKWIKQTRYDFSNAKKDKDYGNIVSGFPLKDSIRHFELQRKCGNTKGEFIGFMDDNTPCRVTQDTCNRMSIKPDRVWVQLLPTIIGINSTKIQSGCQDKYAYCAYDLESAKATFSWYSITKALNGKYPLWANQYDIWSPTIKPELENYWYSLCFAFVLSVNSCVVTKFEKDNPVAGAPEVFVDNPLCPTNKESFWSLYLDNFVKVPNFDKVQMLVNKIKELYRTWNFNYCKGQFLYNVDLKDEPYFKYFDYDDFLTPYSGLIQIKKYAQKENHADLLDIFKEIQELTSLVKEEIYRLLVDEFKYFE